MASTAVVQDLAAFARRAHVASSPPTHTQPYNYDWLWILFVIFAVLLLAGLVYFRVFLPRAHRRHQETAPDRSSGPPDAA